MGNEAEDRDFCERKKGPPIIKYWRAFFVKPEFIMELIQHILPYFAVICHILGGRCVKPGENRKASQTVCLAGGASFQNFKFVLEVLLFFFGTLHQLRRQTDEVLITVQF